MGSMASAAIKEVLKCQKSHVAEECVKCDKDEDIRTSSDTTSSYKEL